MTIFPAVAKLLHHFTPHQHNILQGYWKGEQGEGRRGKGGGGRGRDEGGGDEGTRGKEGEGGREGDERMRGGGRMERGGGDKVRLAESQWWWER